MFAGHDNLNSYIGTIEVSSPLSIAEDPVIPMFSRDEDEGTLKFKGYQFNILDLQRILRILTVLLRVDIVRYHFIILYIDFPGTIGKKPKIITKRIVH